MPIKYRLNAASGLARELTYSCQSLPAAHGGWRACVDFLSMTWSACRSAESEMSSDTMKPENNRTKNGEKRLNEMTTSTNGSLTKKKSRN